MEEKVFLVSTEAHKAAKITVSKARNIIKRYDVDCSTFRTFKILLSLLKYEMVSYDSFICDLLGNMMKHADDNTYTFGINVGDIMAKVPYMSVCGIQATLMQYSSNIALFDIVYTECMDVEDESK